MRTIFLMLLGSMVCISTYAQNIPRKRHKADAFHINERGFYFQKSSGLVYELDSIVWVEDLINNPNYYSEDYNFNEEGINTEKIADLTAMGDYDFVEKEVYGYNIQNIVENVTTLVFDTTLTSPTWRFHRKNDFDFNNEGLVSTEYVSRWDSVLDIWVEYNRYTYLYNQLGLDSVKEEVGKNRWTKTYDNQGRLIKEQYAYKSVSEWKNGYFNIYAYDSLLNETILTYYSSDSLPYSRDIIIYDSLQNPIHEQYLEWDSQMEEFVVYGKVECEYEFLEINEQVNMGNTYMKDDHYFKEVNGYKKNRIQFYEWKDESWILFTDIKFIYKQIGTRIKEISMPQLVVFPNPAKEQIQLFWQGKKQAHLIIYNAFGQLVKSEIISNGNKINVNNLPKGVYYLQLENDQKLFGTKTIMVE